MDISDPSGDGIHGEKEHVDIISGALTTSMYQDEVPSHTTDKFPSGDQALSVTLSCTPHSSLDHTGCTSTTSSTADTIIPIGQSIPSLAEALPIIGNTNSVQHHPNTLSPHLPTTEQPTDTRLMSEYGHSEDAPKDDDFVSPHMISPMKVTPVEDTMIPSHGIVNPSFSSTSNLPLLSTDAFSTLSELKEQMPAGQTPSVFVGVDHGTEQGEFVTSYQTHEAPSSGTTAPARIKGSIPCRLPDFFPHFDLEAVSPGDFEDAILETLNSGLPSSIDELSVMTRPVDINQSSIGATVESKSHDDRQSKSNALYSPDNPSVTTVLNHQASDTQVQRDLYPSIIQSSCHCPTQPTSPEASTPNSISPDLTESRLILAVNSPPVRDDSSAPSNDLLSPDAEQIEESVSPISFAEKTTEIEKDNSQMSEEDSITHTNYLSADDHVNSLSSLEKPLDIEKDHPSQSSVNSPINGDIDETTSSVSIAGKPIGIGEGSPSPLDENSNACVSQSAVNSQINEQLDEPASSVSLAEELIDIGPPPMDENSNTHVSHSIVNSPINEQMEESASLTEKHMDGEHDPPLAEEDSPIDPANYPTEYSPRAEDPTSMDAVTSDPPSTNLIAPTSETLHQENSRDFTAADASGDAPEHHPSSVIDEASQYPVPRSRRRVTRSQANTNKREPIRLSSEKVLTEHTQDDDTLADDNHEGNERRRSLRPRRENKLTEAFRHDKELDAILNDDANVKFYGPAQHWNTGAGDYLSEDWVSVEKIIAHRVLSEQKFTPFITKAIESCAHTQRHMVELEYFVKFHNASYWHCAWISGAVLLAIHPHLLRNYYRTVPSASSSTAVKTDPIHLSPKPSPLVGSAPTNDADRENVASETQTTTTEPLKTDECNIIGPASMIVSHSSDEDDENDVENQLHQWSQEQRDHLSKLVSTEVEKLGARRRYLIRWGVDRDKLIPERILSLGDAIAPESEGTGAENEPAKVTYQEILVKWFNMPQHQCTWETVESDQSMLRIVAKNQNNNCPNYNCRRLDTCGRKLLPLAVRRHLIQLMNSYSTRIARMLCDAYGSGQSITKRLPPKFGDWKKKWTKGQPDYLSPIHKAKLHPYQLEGVRWLWHAYHDHVNAILADEMGLGKTVQVIALLYSLWKERNDYGPYLVIAPLSTLQNWEREFKLWAPDFHVLVYSGDRNLRSIMQEYDFRIPNSNGVAAFHVLITSHELACIERSILQCFDWSALIVDEAHRLKNKQSRLFKEASQYKTTFKILLTGTPLQNTLEELFHLLYFVEPKAINDLKSLSEKWSDLPKEERIESLHAQLKNHLLRRLKSDVISDLPKKTEIVVTVDMSVLQRKLYKLILTKNYEELRCGSLMNSLMHLQKLCDHPYLIMAGDAIAPRVDPNDPYSRYEPNALVQVSGKLVVLTQLLRGLREGGHRVLIYSRMTMMLDILEEVMKNEGYAFERIDGRVKGPTRQVIIDRFNAPNCDTFIFLLSTRAGGEGINLATADTVILYDSDWNPHCDLQALSRAHRIGQSRHVVIYRFLTRHSMEERVNLVAKRKLALTNLVVNPSQQHAADKSAAKSANEAETDLPVVRNEIKTPSQRTGSVSNRLSRAEMDELLRCGLDALFAVDDLLDDEDLKTAANVSAGGEEDSQRIVYDADAIAKLLDRSQLAADEEQSKTEVDEYLSTFRVAHFSTTELTKETGEKPASESCQINEQVTTEDGQLNADESATLGYAAFWDRLLRERHERFLCAEAAALGPMRRLSKTSWGDRFVQQPSPDTLDDDYHLEESNDSVEDFNLDQLDAAAAPVQRRSRRKTKSRIIMTPPSSSSQPTPSQPNAAKTSRNRRKNPHVRSKPGAAPTSAASRPVYKEDSGLFEPVSSPEVNNTNDGGDPNYVPSDDGSDSPSRTKHTVLIDKWRKRSERPKAGRSCWSKDNVVTVDSDDAPIEYDPNEDLASFGNINNSTCVTCFWHPDDQLCSTWKELTKQDKVNSQLSIGPKISWDCGVMFIYGFGPDDRRLFANAVMQYGLPPPGIVPPQDWLPPNLYCKHAVRLFAYTSLFMHHLYEDPNALDDSKAFWSDGLPKENLCGSAVLSRIAMMALIRNKVLQFEDINGVHSRTFEAMSTRFKFSIHEGGLTLLRPTWTEEWQQINQIIGQVVPPKDKDWRHECKKPEKAIFHLQHAWHSRHDYWLLAGVLVHGYSQWTEILADPRFHLIATGLEGLLAKAEKLTIEPTPADVNMTEAQAFLTYRLRLLEQALVVEQALYEVARAALTGEPQSKPPLLSRVQNLAVCLSNKLASAGPRKRIALPRDAFARDATKLAVSNLQEILEDLYADLPALPASVVCADSESDALSISRQQSASATPTSSVLPMTPNVQTLPPPTTTTTASISVKPAPPSPPSGRNVIDISDDDMP